MRVLVTGANGFVGRHLVDALLKNAHEVVAACRPDTDRPVPWCDVSSTQLRAVPLELCSDESIDQALSTEPDAIVHLAAIAYSRDAAKDPRHTWDVNVGGTARLLARIAERSRATTVLVTSSAEVYGEGEPRPRLETDTTRPTSVYGASKLGAEAAAAHAIAAWGLPVIVVRPFPATGPGQTNRLIPNWLATLRDGQRSIEGDAHIVRDFLDVRDTAAGYVSLLATGRKGETYNLASGRGVRFDELFSKLATSVGVNATLVPPSNPRPELPFLVGDSRKLQQHTGWQPTIPLGRTLSDLVDAQAH
ncbi:MAG TPA: NAD-dependent epimerase/dehydratase family protein [Gemmatimonadales bacterium]|nr:NAD-dependent epimerase/dehydratase family protein [Gemmatimonadales bacterium]